MKSVFYELELEVRDDLVAGALVRVMEEAIAVAFDKAGINYSMIYITGGKEQ